MMKKHLYVLLLLVSPVLILSFSFENSNGKAGHTGSPGEQTCARSGCHDSFALNSGPGAMTLTVVGSDDNTYIAGQTYTVTVNIAQSGSNLFGFNIEALQPSGANAGTLNAGSGSQVLNVTVGANSRRNLTHTLGAGASMNQHTFTFTWVAPSDGADVTFYLSGNAANSNGNDGGDYVYTTTLSLTEAIPAIPPVVTSSVNQVCAGEVVTLATSPQPGVTFEWFNDQNASVGFGESIDITPSVSACYSAVAIAGTNTLPSTNSVCIEVSQPLNASFTDLPSTICSNEAPISVSPQNPSGQFSGLNINGEFDPNQSPGSYTVTYVLLNGACTQSSAQTVEILPSPSASFVGLNEAYCSNEDPAQATPIEQGGTFQGSGISSSGLFNPLNAAIGANEITYALLNASGCFASQTLTVFVYDTLNAAFTNLPATICTQAEAIPLIPVNPGGVFSGVGLVNSTWDPSSAGPGEFIIQYALNLGQCVESSSDTVLVLQSPDPELSDQPDTLCGFDFFPFPILSFNPSTTVTGSAVVDGVFFPDLAQLGYNVVEAQLIGANGCIGIATDSIWIQALPEA
ncbi:MAG: choice-of-anchor V domain-containing protein, partial [Flavobacteriales bacterium]